MPFRNKENKKTGTSPTDQPLSSGMSSPFKAQANTSAEKTSRFYLKTHTPAISFRKATGLSILAHVLSPFLSALAVGLLLLILSWILHLNFWDWFKPKEPPKDLEFSLVKDTQAKQPEKPLFQGNFNQQAGGKQNKKQPLKPVEEQPSPKGKPASSKANPNTVTKQSPPTQNKATPEQEKTKPAEAKRPPALLSDKTSSTQNQAAKDAQAQQNPEHTEAKDKSANNTVAPGGNTLLGSVGQGSNTSSNPQDGPGLTPGVDVAQNADFGPFMADLEKRIKRNWIPPRGAESRKVILMFYLSRDGHVVKIEVQKTSGDRETDESAAQAVNASAPFMTFPPQVKEDILPVEFTFDYNVLNPKNPKQALKW